MNVWQAILHIGFYILFLPLFVIIALIILIFQFLLKLT